MSIFDGVRRQLRSVIDWTDPDPGLLFSRWTENGEEIKNASKLIVNPGQGCIFVYRGQVAAVIEKPGSTDLRTQNIPFWTTVTKYMQAFRSEYTVGIYFYQTKRFLNQKWGTSSTIKYEDPKYGFPVGLRAYGNYSFRIEDAKGFFVNVVASAADYGIEEFRQVVGARMVQPLTDYLASAQYTYAEIDANREEIAAGMRERLTREFADLGFEMADFRIEGTNFDEDTMRRINRIADTAAEAQAAAAAGLNYAQLQQLGALRDAARNEGGAAGAGVGLGAGIGLGQMAAGTMGMISPAGGLGVAGDDPAAKLRKLKELLDGGLISPAEFEEKKKQVLARL